MKLGYAIALVFIMIALVISCGQKLTEEQLRAKALDFENKEQWDEVVKVFEEMIARFPDSPRADENLYQLGGLYASNFQDYEKSIQTYKQLIENYPESNLVVQAHFMIGYRYANDVKDLDKARTAYEEFIAKYPDHELVQSVKWELENLGKDISDIELQLGESESSN